MALRGVVVWCGILVLAVLNGAVREGIVRAWTGEVVAHVISTVMLCALVLLAARMTIGWLAPRSLGDAWRIGAMWVVMTVAFEFLGGHYLFGRSWQFLLADYDVLRGRIWVLVLIVTAVAPAASLILNRSSTNPPSSNP